MDVFIANEQEDVDLAESSLVSLARLAAAEEGVDPRAELSILLVDAESMTSLKEKWLGEPGVTDVLAFPLDEQPAPDEPYLIGDIVICPAAAVETSKGSGGKVTDEVELLLVHGFLHLLGYDHVRPQDAKAMRHRERKILQEFRRRDGS